MTSSETKDPSSEIPAEQMLLTAAPPGFQPDINNLMSNRSHLETFPQWVSPPNLVCVLSLSEIIFISL